MLLKIMNRIRGTTYYTDGYDLYNVNGNIVFCPSKRSYSAFVKRKGGD